MLLLLTTSMLTESRDLMCTNMAAQGRSQPVQACCSTEQVQPQVTTTQDPPSNNQGNEPEYDFVEQPDQDCFCHILQAANRLIRERKPCPMCKEENFTAHINKHFKRKTINTLKVRCPHKKNGCEWVGELGDLNNHSTSCPKRPWKCQYCQPLMLGQMNTPPTVPSTPCLVPTNVRLVQSLAVMLRNTSWCALYGWWSVSLLMLDVK